MEKKAARTGKKPMMTNFAVYNLDRNNTFDYSKAEQELGYHTRSYEETLRDEARWLVTEGKIRGNVSLKDDASEKRTLADKLQGLMKNHTPVRHTAQA
jgi:dihydroflavonol-4-reductase